MKLLVTGGCGFLGSNIASAYLEQGAEVVVIDALFRTGGESNLEWLQAQAKAKQFRHHKIDLAEEDAVESIFQKEGPFGYICHLGGQVAMTTSLADPRRDFRTNALGTFNVLENMRKHSPEALLAYSSTNKVYGDLERIPLQEKATRYTAPSYPEGFDENLPLDFASPYGCSKGSADQYVRDWYRNFGLQTVVFRHSSIYGGRQFSSYDQGWIGWFCRKALEQRGSLRSGNAPASFTISGTGKQVRDVLHAGDLIHLYQLAYARRSEAAGQIFNIGGGLDNSLSLLELFALLEQKLELPSGTLVYERIARRQSDQDFFVADIRKAQHKLGWTPRVPFDTGLNQMLAWCEEAI